MGSTRIDRIEGWSRWPLLILALLFLVVLYFEYWGSYGEATRRWAAAAEYAIHAVFAFELLARILSVDDKLNYIKQNWFDLGTVVLPPLRLLRAWRQRLKRET